MTQFEFSEVPLSTLAQGLVGSEILRISAEITARTGKDPE